MTPKVQDIAPLAPFPPAPNQPLRDFLSEIYSLSEQEQPRRASDVVFDFLEGHFEGGRFDSADETLRAISVDRLSDTILVAALAVTAPARDHLPARAAFVERVEQYLTRRLGVEEAAAIVNFYR